ncbi:hypothetical protein [Brevundimonas sp. SL161]|uniref:hypothetical protein n=1 Tax=Brevundimonas sp. SL161 TaxID=2804613 RepID=UPI003CEDB73B
MILVSVALATAISMSDPQAADILSKLDMTTFRNSLRPRAAEGLERPADWGFAGPTNEAGWAYLTQQVAGRRSWTIGLTIIRQEGEAVVACFSDQARNGGTYYARSAVRIVSDGEGGYRVDQQGSDEPTCQPAPGQG